MGIDALRRADAVRPRNSPRVRYSDKSGPRMAVFLAARPVRRLMSLMAASIRRSVGVRWHCALIMLLRLDKLEFP
jgi:hypothetical protein